MPDVNSTVLDISDIDVKDGMISTYQIAVKCYSYFYHISFLETCKYVNIRPKGLNIEKTPFISFTSHELSVSWRNTINAAEEQLLDTLLKGLAEKMMDFEEKFWNSLKETEGETDREVLIEWWAKLSRYLERFEKRVITKKKKKLRKLITGEENKLLTAFNRFEAHFSCFAFKNSFKEHGSTFCADLENIVNLLSLSGSTNEETLNIDTTNTEKECHEAENDKGCESSSEFAEEQEGRLRGKFVSANVLNLSKRALSSAEISLLSKGLKFVPTPRFVDQAAIKTDLESFGRKLRLAWHFRNDDRVFEPNPFKPKSNFDPKDNDAAIELYLSKLEEEILEMNTKLKYHNVTREERRAIDSLRNDPSIIIKGADKGSCIVVWDREDYLSEAEKQLGVEDVYEKLEGEVVSPLVSVIKKCLANIQRRGDISKETLDYFLVKNPKVGRFYLLPKIHKRLHNVPGRPVISNNGFFTENISAFLDYHLQPLAKKVKSFVKDTNDFLKKIADLPPLSDNVLLCTIDVVGLYPNIPHNDGLEALKRALDGREDKSISTQSLLELSQCVLENNVFEHNGGIYKQKQGTAIGTKMAPPYAILFMDYLEERLIDTFPLKPLVWWRYIDDVFLLWEHGEESLKHFLEHINNAHQTIKFTANYSSNKINFLDVEVIRKEGTLLTDLYVKPTDTHQYLDASSCHPAHCINSIPYSQALRLNRICSEGSFFDRRCNELESWLLKRGYNDKSVRRKILDARRYKRLDLLNRERVDTRKSKITLNITYHPAFQNLNRLLHKVHVILSCDKEHRKVFNHTPIVGFRRAKSLKDFLVRAKVPPLEKPVGNSEGCGSKRCGVCSFVKCTDEFVSKCGRSYKIRDHKLNCNSANVVYLLNCKACGVQYVGSCSTAFRLRFNNYKSCNNRHRAKKVPQQHLHDHFDLPGHNGREDWEFILIDKGDSKSSVRQKEKFWQYKLKSFLPNGLNDREVYTMD